MKRLAEKSETWLVKPGVIKHIAGLTSRSAFERSSIVNIKRLSCPKKKVSQAKSNQPGHFTHKAKQVPSAACPFCPWPLLPALPCIAYIKWHSWYKLFFFKVGQLCSLKLFQPHTAAYIQVCLFIVIQDLTVLLIRSSCLSLLGMLPVDFTAEYTFQWLYYFSILS